MGDFDEAFVEAVKVQSWSLYSVGMLFICTRIFARIKRLGFRHLQIDDYLMVLVAGLYTALTVTLNVICQGGGSNLYPPELTGTFTEEEIQERIYGSKIVVVSEQAMLNVIYSIKTCMLIMYTRLTLGLTTQKMVRYLACYVAVGWVATQIAFFTACRPFEGYWAMPPPDPQCTTLEHYAMVQGCFNISSDLLMLFIPIPLVLKVNMPWRQKAVLLVIFSMGTFVIIAALMTKIYNLTNVWDPSYMLWYIRESFVAVLVSNMPMIWPLLREIFPFLRHLTPTRPSAAGGALPGGYGGYGGYAKKGGSSSGGGNGSRSATGSAGGSALRSISGTATPSRGIVRGIMRNSRRVSLDSTYDMELALKSDVAHVSVQPTGNNNNTSASSGNRTPPNAAGASSSSNTPSLSSPASSSRIAAEASSSTEQIVPGAAPPPGTASTTTEVVAPAVDRRGVPLSGIHIERTVEVRAEPDPDAATDAEKGSGGGQLVFDWAHHGRSTHHANASHSQSPSSHGHGHGHGHSHGYSAGGGGYGLR